MHPGLAPLVIERNVLEWRLDPRSEARTRAWPHLDRRVIVLCQEGYTSSLAADALLRLGLHRATDMAGGFAAWRAAGLPVRRPPPEADRADASLAAGTARSARRSVADAGGSVGSRPVAPCHPEEIPCARW